RAGAQAWPDILQHAAHDLRHAGQYEDVADHKAGRAVDRIDHQLAALGDAGHAAARGVQLFAEARFHLGDDAGVLVQLHPEGGRHAVGGDVVVGGADAAGGEQVVIALAQDIDGRHDLGLDIADHPRLAYIHAVGGEVAGDGVEVHVLGAAGE